MKLYNILKKVKLLVLGILTALFITSCSNDDDKTEVLQPSFENIEIGSGNNKKGIIGRDFHFEMDVVAGDRINTIKVLFKQKAGVSYSKEWAFEIGWEEFKGLKSTNVHKHFTIPSDAAEGLYDFIIQVSDQNGTLREESVIIELIGADKLPVNPELYSFMLQKNDKDFVYILNRGFMLGDDKGFKKNEILKAYVDISKVKDKGILYTLLIKKSAGHMPESVQDIDFSKVLVTDVRAHENMTEVKTFTNYVDLPNYSPKQMVIGSDTDNNIPVANPIQGNKAWENGEYYFGIVYTNQTHNMSVHYYIPITMSGF